MKLSHRNKHATFSLDFNSSSSIFERKKKYDDRQIYILANKKSNVKNHWKEQSENILLDTVKFIARKNFVPVKVQRT